MRHPVVFGRTRIIAHRVPETNRKPTRAIASHPSPSTIGQDCTLSPGINMLWATYTQQLDPLADHVFWSPVWSTLFAALPVLVLFWLLVPRRWLAPKAGAAGAVTALVVAVAVYGMPADMAAWSFVHGAAFGLLPLGLAIFNPLLLYHNTLPTGPVPVVP